MFQTAKVTFKVAQGHWYCCHSKGNIKCGKWGSLGQLEISKVTRNSTIRHSAYDFLLAFHSSYVPSPYLAPFLRQ